MIISVIITEKINRLNEYLVRDAKGNGFTILFHKEIRAIQSRSFLITILSRKLLN